MQETVIVAVSAGPDSMALLHMLHQKNYKIIVAHVNYHQRLSSTRDESCAFEYAKKLNHIFEKKDFNIEVTGNFQSIARDFRYNFFKELYDKYNAKALYLGHHQDDDLETYLMQKASNRTTHYPGIKEETTINEMNIVRPLLHMSKEMILNYCKDNQVPYEIDESNLETNYTRNKMRHQISKLSKNEKKALLKEMYQAKKEKEVYHLKLPKLSTVFEIDTYKTIEQTIRLDSLRQYLQNRNIDTASFSEKYLKTLDDRIIEGKAQIPIQDKILSISYNEVAVIEDNSFEYIIHDTKPHQTKHYEIKETGQTIEGITLSEADFPLTIRSPKPNDKIHLRFGTKSLNRFFIDRKIPVHERTSWLVVENSMKEIVFVVGLGCDIHHYSIKPSVFMIKLWVS